MSSDTLEDKIFDTVGVACGAVSMCWDPRPDGVFESKEAGDYVRRAVRRIMAHIEEEYR